MRARTCALTFLSAALVVATPQMVASAAPKTSKLTVYAYDSFSSDLIKTIKADMKNKGVDVTFRTFEDTGFMYNQLLKEKSKPVAGAVIGLDNIYAIQAKSDKILTPYKPKAASSIRPDLVFDPSYLLTPFDYGLVTFCYDSEKMPNPPKTWEDLLSPSLKSQIVIENPLTSSPGQALLYATIAKYGEAKYLDFWKKFKGNLLTMAPGWSAAYGMFTNGEVPLVLSYGTSPVYHLMYEKTERYKALLLEDAAWAQIEGVGVVKGSKQEAAAKAFVDYVVGTKFQTDLQEAQFMYPVRSDVKLSPNFRVAVSTKNLLNSKVDLALLAANKNKWMKEWEAAMNSTTDKK